MPVIRALSAMWGVGTRIRIGGRGHNTLEAFAIGSTARDRLVVKLVRMDSKKQNTRIITRASCMVMTEPNGLERFPAF